MDLPENLVVTTVRQLLMDLIELVNQYRKADTLDDRLRIADKIVREVGPQLRAFILAETQYRGFGSDGVDDIYQRTLEGIAVGLLKFRGKTEKLFWGWCYKIARHKLIDSLRQLAKQRAQPMAMEAIEAIIDASEAVETLSPADKADLDYAMALLREADPKCFHVIWNRYIWGWNFKEIAESFGLSRNASRMKIMRCLHSLRDLVRIKGKATHV